MFSVENRKRCNMFNLQDIIIFDQSKKGQTLAPAP